MKEQESAAFGGDLASVMDQHGLGEYAAVLLAEKFTLATVADLTNDDMKELGIETEKLHKEIGKYAAQAGVDELWAVGALSEFTVQGFGGNARHFDD